MAQKLGKWRKFKKRAEGNSFYEDDRLRSRALDHFRTTYLAWEWNKDLDILDTPILPVVYVTDIEQAWSILGHGFNRSSIQCQGHYGKGIYFFSSALYTIPYLARLQKPSIMICFILPGNPYPVTESIHDSPNFKGVKLKKGYNSHYVVTTREGRPFSEKNYQHNETQYNEIIIAQKTQILPLFLVGIDKDKLSPLESEWERISDSLDDDLSAEEVVNVNEILGHITYE